MMAKRTLATLALGVVVAMTPSAALASNEIKVKLVEAAEKALTLPQFTGKLQPRFTATGGALFLGLPLVKHDGSGAYVAKLTFELACTQFASAAITLFDKVPALKQLSFSGIHRGKVVFDVALTRAQYVKLGLRKLEEKLGAYQGGFIEKLMNKKITARAVSRKVNRRRLAVYRKAFATLPAGQVKIVKALLR